MKTSWLVAAASAICALSTVPAMSHETGEKVTPGIRQVIPNIPGKSLVSVIVDYAPGGETPAHVHAKSAFIYGYVVSGAIESQIDDGPRQVIRAGEGFYENPGAKHPISRNASKTKPARLLAVFVVDTDDKELTTIVH